jgi:hypothetical protein
MEHLVGVAGIRHSRRIDGGAGVGGHGFLSMYETSYFYKPDL